MNYATGHTMIHTLRLAGLGAAALLLMQPVAAFAHGGEDHSHGPEPAAVPATQGGAPKRLPDGGLFVPKAVQHRLGLRTLPASLADLAESREFNGRVIADPAASGRVQASQAGRVETAGKSFPLLGQAVARGQVLARLRPVAASLERSGQRALLAELEAQIALAERRLDRYSQLEGAIPAKDVEATRIELAALRQRRAAIGDGLEAAEALVAPAAGVISAAHVVPGQVVEAREILFEIVDPRQLAVEALAYDPAHAAGLANARLVYPGGTLPLQFVGAGRQMREQALPLLFRVRGDTAGLAAGMPVQVVAAGAGRVRGAALPAAALQRGAGGETTVWVKLAPERFVQRRVEARPLDGDRVAVTAGLAEGERVVVGGASLLGQVR
jgi:hypothetical protein